MSRTRVHNLMISADGYAAGDRVTLEEPIGDAMGLFRAFDGRVIHGIDGVPGPVNADQALFSLWGQGIGAEIMGRRKFGPQSGPWTDDGWRGWWGEQSPFGTPIIVLSHHPREDLVLEDGTLFRFVDASPAEALCQARELAGGADVRLGGGPSTVRDFLAADLVDLLHLVVVPIVLGRGVRLLDGLEGLQERFAIESVTTGSGLVHQLWNRWPS